LSYCTKTINALQDIEEARTSKRQGHRGDKDIEETRTSRRQGHRRGKDIEEARTSKRQGHRRGKDIEEARTSRRQAHLERLVTALVAKKNGDLQPGDQKNCTVSKTRG
jgi:hypothetical protein